jgi:hypothetical protein
MSARSLITAVLGGALIAGSLLGAGAASAVNPYNSDGTWLVPAEIAPGTYRVSLTDSSGYSETCADYTCEIGTSGFINNALYDGPGVLVVPSNAVSVKLRGVSLTRMG